MTGKPAPVSHFSAASDRGLVRGNNEDNHLCMPEHGLWLVADGMGGHAAGEVASAIAVETIRKRIQGGETLVNAIHQAHEAVLAAAEKGLGARGMGSTVVALRSHQHRYQVAWVGDSRAYLWSPGKAGGTLEQLSRDHSYVQRLLASGAIDEYEASIHPKKNVISQCLGAEDPPRIQVDTVVGEWREKQWIVLCSDGLTDELSNEAIARTLSESRSVREAVSKLMQRALDHGGRDNITVQVIESPLRHPSRLEVIKRWFH